MSRKKSLGFSLVELMLVAAGMAGLALIVMQLGKNSMQTQGDAFANADYIQLQKEVNFLISDSKSCSASLKNVTFNGATVKNSPVLGLELWSADQTGARSRKKFYGTQTYEKVTINSIGLSMPDYTAGVNFAAGTNQSFVAEVKISGAKKNLGKTKSFHDIIQSIIVKFDTDAAGLSTIKSCYAANSFLAPTVVAGDACDITIANVAVDATGAVLSCQGSVWTAPSTGGDLREVFTLSGITASSGDISVNLTKPSIVILTMNSHGSPGSAGGGYAMPSAVTYINGVKCAIDRGTDGSSSNAYASATCVRLMPAGTVILKADCTYCSTRDWNFQVIE